LLKLEHFKHLSFELDAFGPAVILKAMTVLGVIFAVYHQDLQLILFDALQNEATNQALLVLPIFGFLIYRKRKMIRAVTSFEETNPQELQSQNPEGLLLTPPGLALSKLLEKENRKPFTETSLKGLQKQLPKLLEELQITKNATAQTEGNTVIIETNNHIFEDLCKETRKLEKTHETIGCPLSSALACLLAKATGKPVTIEKEETLPDATTRIQYTLLEE